MVSHKLHFEVYLLFFTSCVFAMRSLSSSHKINATRISITRIILITSIKQGDFFASLAFLAQNPEKISVCIVVDLPATGAALVSQNIITNALCYPFPNIGCQVFVQLADAAFKNINASGVVYSCKRSPLRRAFGRQALDHTLNIIRGCSPCIDADKRLLPLAVLPAKVFQLVVAVFWDVIGAFLGQFRFFTRHISFSFYVAQAFLVHLALKRMIRVKPDDCVTFLFFRPEGMYRFKGNRLT